MKNKKLTLTVLALILGATTVFAQGWRNANRPGYGYGYGYGYGPGYGTSACLNVLPGLTEDQKTKITELDTTHQKAMAELRVKQRSTFDPVEKNEIRGEMLKKVQAHRDEVRGLLTEEQLKQYNLLQTRNNYGRGGFGPGCRGRGRRGPAGYAGRGARGFRGGW